MQFGRRFAGDLRYEGLLVWVGGNWNGEGTVTVATNGVLQVVSGNDHDLAGHALVNLGRMERTGGRMRGGAGSVIRNEGTWEDATDAAINSDYGGLLSVRNTGLYRRTAGTGNMAIVADWNESGRSVYEVGATGFYASGSFAGTTVVAAGASVTSRAATPSPPPTCFPAPGPPASPAGPSSSTCR